MNSNSQENTRASDDLTEENQSQEPSQTEGQIVFQEDTEELDEGGDRNQGQEQEQEKTQEEEEEFDPMQVDKVRQEALTAKLEGNSNFAAKDFVAAMECYIDAIRMISQIPEEMQQESDHQLELDCYNNFAKCKYKQGNFVEAYNYCSRILQRLGINYTTIYIRACCLETLGDLEQAKNDLMYCLRHFPDREEAKVNLERVIRALEKKKRESYANNFTKAIHEDSDSEEEYEHVHGPNCQHGHHNHNHNHRNHQYHHQHIPMGMRENDVEEWLARQYANMMRTGDMGTGVGMGMPGIQSRKSAEEVEQEQIALAIKMSLEEEVARKQKEDEDNKIKEEQEKQQADIQSFFNSYMQRKDSFSVEDVGQLEKANNSPAVDLSNFEYVEEHEYEIADDNLTDDDCTDDNNTSGTKGGNTTEGQEEYEYEEVVEYEEYVEEYVEEVEVEGEGEDGGQTENVQQ